MKQRKQKMRSDRLEYILWRNLSGQLQYYKINNLLKNSSFFRGGKWAAELNLIQARIREHVYETT